MKLLKLVMDVQHAYLVQLPIQRLVKMLFQTFVLLACENPTIRLIRPLNVSPNENSPTQNALFIFHSARGARFTVVFGRSRQREANKFRGYGG